ncbi:hypothetical protein [Paenibacillus lentus]|nr:hypothetical protein [Paenibacillus lentus]
MKANDIVVTFEKAGSEAGALLQHKLRRIAFTDEERGTIPGGF